VVGVWGRVSCLLRNKLIDIISVAPKTTFVIKSFGDKRTEHIFEGRYVKRLDNELQRKTLRRLRYIDAA